MTTGYTTSEELHLAADLIEKKGWGQGVATWQGLEGFCIEGAIAAIAGIKALKGCSGPSRTELEACPTYLAMAEYLGVNPHSVNGLYMWNDADGQTAERVVETLRAAAVIQQARETQESVWATYAGSVTA